ncbi:aldehyde dehydrogenase (NADP(+)) [Micromonospora sp. NBC_01796]|uniref:aldehyde dehydrogenase (NADP(+)) n=1 Tax=Micromonospora sp. NBC_01796 TaxID=2975987 RepID=UPI002DDA7F8A|nr:aldehyde dehydrogenase (NADP(+)) [Micromonospora sp. NBC_01796]WSA86446.1 aldehyde dehydrogenase (NADP(+)) [Micromonospora sp. NBC_01796]
MSWRGIAVETTGFDQGMDPQTGTAVGAPVAHTSAQRVDRVARAAAAAAPVLAGLLPGERAGLLRAVGAALEGARDELVELADRETGLGPVRLGGELTRTTVQLEFFAAALEEGSLLEAVVDPADPAALPAPRPDLRRILVPLGPVAVFAASNFPFAFSVAGGDTASALAAGCPVVVKAHPGHPGLSVLSGRIVADALTAAGAPPGSFAVVHGIEAGRALVTHPAIRAVGFTGSEAGGRALFDLANARPDPIPFYGELGSLNPTVLTPAAIAARSAELAAGFVASFTMGAGQFCTKPGLLFLPAGHGLEPALLDALRAATIGPLLNNRIRDGYTAVAATLAGVPGVRDLAPVDDAERAGYRVPARLLAVSVTDLLARPDDLLAECFGPAALLVEYADHAELLAALAVLPGSLTASLHAELPDDDVLARHLVEVFTARAGRIIWNGWPTGVAVTWAMQHGGPWPATTASIHTSVGQTAARRFLRPVAYQGLPQELLPVALRDGNPLGIVRRTDGVLGLDTTAG